MRYGQPTFRRLVIWDNAQQGTELTQGCILAEGTHSVMLACDKARVRAVQVAKASLLVAMV